MKLAKFFGMLGGGLIIFGGYGAINYQLSIIHLLVGQMYKKCPIGWFFLSFSLFL